MQLPSETWNGGWKWKLLLHVNGSVYKWVILCHVSCFLIPPPHHPHFYSQPPVRCWYYEQTQALAKEYWVFFFPVCYAAVRRENEMTLWKYNIKIHKIVGRLGTVVGKSFSTWLVLFWMGSYRWLTVKWDLKAKILRFVFCFKYCFCRWTSLTSCVV